MGKCLYCGKNDYLGKRCRYCGKYVCCDHILPEKHDCEWLKEEKKRFSVETKIDTPSKTYSKSPLYFERLIRDLTKERLLTHLVWEHLEEEGYEVYGEAQISEGRKRIDLICVCDDLIGLIEIKRKKRLSYKDESQIIGYLERARDSKKFDDLVIVFELHSIADWASTRLGVGGILVWNPKMKNHISPKLVFAGITESTLPPYYQLFLDRSINFERNFIREEEPVLRRDNEIWIEHKVWKKLKDEGYLVLPQVKLEDMEIDLWAEKDDEIIAIEVKGPRGKVMDKQMEKYDSLPEWITPILIVSDEYVRRVRDRLRGRRVKVTSYSNFLREF